MWNKFHHSKVGLCSSCCCFTRSDNNLLNHFSWEHTWDVLWPLWPEFTKINTLYGHKGYYMTYHCSDAWNFVFLHQCLVPWVYVEPIDLWAEAHKWPLRLHSNDNKNQTEQIFTLHTKRRWLVSLMSFLQNGHLKTTRTWWSHSQRGWGTVRTKSSLKSEERNLRFSKTHRWVPSLCADTH